MRMVEREMDGSEGEVESARAAGCMVFRVQRFISGPCQ